MLMCKYFMSGLNDLYESFASQFLALLWIVQKIKNWNGLKTSCQKKERKKKIKKRKCCGSEKMNTPKRAEKKTISKNKKIFLFP